MNGIRIMVIPKEKNNNCGFDKFLKLLSNEILYLRMMRIKSPIEINN